MTWKLLPVVAVFALVTACGSSPDPDAVRACGLLTSAVDAGDADGLVAAAKVAPADLQQPFRVAAATWVAQGMGGSVSTADRDAAVRDALSACDKVGA